MTDLWPLLALYKKHLGLLLLGIVLSIATLTASISLLTLSGWFITATAIAGLSSTTAQSFNFFTPGAGVRGFSIARTAGRYGERLVSHDATFRILSSLRSWFFSKLIPMPGIELEKFRKGDLLNRLVADIDALDQLYLRILSPLVTAIVITVFLSLFLAIFNIKLALLVCAVMVTWILLMPLIFYKLGNKTGALLGKAVGDLRQETLDYLQGLAENQIYGYEHHSRNAVKKSEEKLISQQKIMSALDGFRAALIVTGSGLATLLMLYLASGAFIREFIHAPVMVMMVFALLAAFEVLMPLPVAFQYLSHVRYSASRLRDVVRSEPESEAKIETEIETESVRNNSADTRLLKERLSGDIHFANVRCGYQTDQPVLDDCSLSVKAGTHFAVIGKTGCGKSTMARLLSRSIEPFSGRITLDEQSITAFSDQALYSNITFVPQKTHVFSGTLRDNLTLAQPEANDGQLQKVIERTGLTELAAAADESSLLDQWIGQGGILLSGGEQRRLAMARALLRPSSVLVLDEPCEGLDVISERRLMNEVLNAFKLSTVFLITHKKVMLEQMDRVYLMQSGKLKPVK